MDQNYFMWLFIYVRDIEFTSSLRPQNAFEHVLHHNYISLIQIAYSFMK